MAKDFIRNVNVNTIKDFVTLFNATNPMELEINNNFVGCTTIDIKENKLYIYCHEWVIDIISFDKIKIMHSLMIDKEKIAHYVDCYYKVAD